MKKVLLILENDDVPEEQNLSLVTQKLIGDKIDCVVFDPIGGFRRKVPSATVGIIVGGGLPSVNDPKAWIEDEAALILQEASKGIPILGICFGHQLISKAFGACVLRRERRVGFAEIIRIKDNPIFDGLPPKWRSAVYHHDRVEEVPDGFELIATSNYCTVQALAHKNLPIWSVQFHPEINYGINNYFADPVSEWDDKASFEPEPNKRLIDNFVEICLRSG
ncbi:MAG: gamma-glutamyl-gamma-aminobutyrate hydrolase family protein [Firmicutes bacterium]|nr:gamma-glutamyl-gamma-aminobutyrate hydrolase family protein [Bacillota bacterium]